MSRHVDNPERRLCTAIVGMCPSWRAYVKAAKIQKEALIEGMNSNKQEGSIRSGAISKPTENTTIQVVEIDAYVSNLQRILDVVDNATENIGFGYDEAKQQAIRNCILLNAESGFRVPYDYLDCPIKRTAYFAAKSKFLDEICRGLNLCKKY